MNSFSSCIEILCFTMKAASSMNPRPKIAYHLHKICICKTDQIPLCEFDLLLYPHKRLKRRPIATNLGKAIDRSRVSRLHRMLGWKTVDPQIRRSNGRQISRQIWAYLWDRRNMIFTGTRTRKTKWVLSDREFHRRWWLTFAQAFFSLQREWEEFDITMRKQFVNTNA